MLVLFLSQNQNQTPDKTLTAVSATCPHKVSHYLDSYLDSGICRIKVRNYIVSYLGNQEESNNCLTKLHTKNVSYFFSAIPHSPAYLKNSSLFKSGIDLFFFHLLAQMSSSAVSYLILKMRFVPLDLSDKIIIHEGLGFSQT